MCGGNSVENMAFPVNSAVSVLHFTHTLSTSLFFSFHVSCHLLFRPTSYNNLAGDGVPVWPIEEEFVALHSSTSQQACLQSLESMLCSATSKMKHALQPH